MRKIRCFTQRTFGRLQLPFVFWSCLAAAPTGQIVTLRCAFVCLSVCLWVQEGARQCCQTFRFSLCQFSIFVVEMRKRERTRERERNAWSRRVFGVWTQYAEGGACWVKRSCIYQVLITEQGTEGTEGKVTKLTGWPWMLFRKSESITTLRTTELCSLAPPRKFKHTHTQTHTHLLSANAPPHNEEIQTKNKNFFFDNAINLQQKQAKNLKSVLKNERTWKKPRHAQTFGSLKWKLEATSQVWMPCGLIPKICRIPQDMWYHRQDLS